MERLCKTPEARSEYSRREQTRRRQRRTQRRPPIFSRPAAMLLLSLFALFALPLCLAATKDTQDDLVRLAKASNGIIKLDERTYDLLTASDREWSATIVFTALDARRKCGPCK